MVITLKGGTQLRFDVDDFLTDVDGFKIRVDNTATHVYNSRTGVENLTLGMAPFGSVLRSLEWTRAVGSTSSLAWLDPGEIAAIHGEVMRPVKPGDTR
jgi:hypothetical protein